eukprot:2677159-Prymnesium_polylepis.1
MGVRAGAAAQLSMVMVTVFNSDERVVRFCDEPCWTRNPPQRYRSSTGHASDVEVQSMLLSPSARRRQPRAR